MKTLVQEFLWIAIPKAVAGVGTILVNFVLIHELGPQAFGAYSLCLTGILLADGVIGSGFDVAVLKLATPARATDLVKSYQLERSALLTKLAICLAASVVVLILAKPVSQTLFHMESALSLIMPGCLAAVGLLAMRSIQVHLQVDHRFRAYGGVDLAHSVLRFGAIGLVVWLLPPNPNSILFVIAAAPWIVFVAGLGTVGRNLVGSTRGLQPVTWELVDFVRWSVLTAGVATFGRQVDMLLLSSRANMSEVGIFSGGQVLSSIPDMFGMYLSVILSPRIMRYLQAGTFFPFFKRVQVFLWIGAVVALIIGLSGLDLIRQYMLPERYARSTGVFAILLPGALAGTVSFPLSIAFVMFVRPTFLFKLELIILPLTVVFYLLVIDPFGAVGAAWVTTGARLIKAVILGFVAWRLARESHQVFSTDSLQAGQPPAG